MSFTWSPDQEPPSAQVTPAGWIRAGLRVAALVVFFATGTGVMILLRLVERPLHGTDRPWTPFITQTVYRLSLFVLGMRRQTVGEQMNLPGAVVANHASWLDIITLNTDDRVYFVSKSEVAGWPVIGFLARMVGTVFIARDPRQAHTQRRIFEERLSAGHKLLFFPEGTSTDGMRVLPFKSTLFEAFFSEGLRDKIHIQPVTVVYEAPAGQDPRFYGWWGDMDLGPHLLQVLSARRNGTVRLIYHTPVRVADFDGRKALARQLEKAVRAGMPSERQLAN